jgi:hypothetical protein
LPQLAEPHKQLAAGRDPAAQRRKVNVLRLRLALDIELDPGVIALLHWLTIGWWK